MNLGSRDRRALALLGVALLGILTYIYWPESETTKPAVSGEKISQHEKMMLKLRQRAAAVPAREDTIERVKKALGEREKGLIKADTAPQAQAQMVQIVRRILRAQQPPLEIRSIDPASPKPFGKNYGAVTATVQLDGKIEQVVNLLADLGNQPELIATEEVQIGEASPKDKRLSVRIVVSGLVDRKLIPEKPRAPGGF